MDYERAQAKYIGGAGAGAYTTAVPPLDMPAGQDTSENLQSRARRKARESAHDSARHTRLAEKLTPEIEATLWCWQEALALGLIDVRDIGNTAAREAHLRRGHF